MKPALQRRIARLESAASERQSASSGPLTVSSFMAQVQERIRLTKESFEEAVPVLLERLRDDELEALLHEAEASAGQPGVSSVPAV